ncbi:TIGR02301 family protein [Kaistia soli DSM 19436]|uniref:TIGR02301 family protein n=1 Tax=Kaistia soli DSM 19436 TaxID=1122133 RepID=A0A1M4VN32_9HYPH|nr:TIGR02301 family protein [Kaistia soli]SHE70285.1 TIGR02301 family protein [Kaistia soli DSM 19436]
MRFSSFLTVRRLRVGAVAPMLVVAFLAAGNARAADPPYDAPLVRLAEILGALHYLRPLCGATEPSLWRDQMEALVMAEAPSPERRARLTAAFNQGYSGFAALYRSCTPAAVAAIDRYLDEGARLTREVTTRYGGDVAPQR